MKFSKSRTKHSRNAQDIEKGKAFLDKYQKAEVTEVKIDKWNFIRI